MELGDKFTWREGDLTHVDTGLKRYAGPRTGQGRWAVLAGIGLLWTNDADGASIGPIDEPGDAMAASAVARRLKAMATNTDLTAGQAFDRIVLDYPAAVVQQGDISHLFDEWLARKRS